MIIDPYFRPIGFLIIAIVALAAPAITAHADNVVQNPGFEADAALLTGPCGGTIPSIGAQCSTVTNWAVSGDAGEDTTNPNSGVVDAFLGTGSLSQALPTVAGATYSISFFLAADEGTLDDAFVDDANVDVNFGGDDLGAIDALNDYVAQGAGAGAYSQQNFMGTAGGNGMLLTLTGTNPGGTWYIDDVNVTCTANCSLITAVPEPSSLSLTLAAFLALTVLGAARKRSGLPRS